MKSLYLAGLKTYQGMRITCNIYKTYCFTHQKFSIRTDCHAHHMTFVTYHALNSFPMTGEYYFFLSCLYIPCTKETKETFESNSVCVNHALQ